MSMQLADYGRMRTRSVGEYRAFEPHSIGSFLNPKVGTTLLADVTVTPVTAATVYAFRLYSSEGESFDITANSGAGPTTNAQLVTLWYNYALTLPELKNQFTITNLGTSLQFKAKAANAVWQIAKLADDGKFTVLATPGSNVDIKVGRFVTYGPAGAEPGSLVTMVPLSAGTTGPQISGFTVVNTSTHVLDENLDAFVDFRRIRPSEIGSVLRMGIATGETETTVAAGAPVYTRRNAGELGVLRSDDAGGDAVLVPGCRFHEPATTSGNILVPVDIEILLP